MARTGITYNEVTAAIDKIIANGEGVTIMGIREVLGTGSPNTIHRHLKAWQSAQPPAKVRVVELPPALADALTQELARQVSEARSEIKDELQRALDDADYLSSDGEKRESDIEDLREQLAIKDNEIGNLKADFDRVTDSLARTQNDLSAERALVNEMRDELALVKNRVMTLTDQVTDLKSELATTKADAKSAHYAQVKAEKAAAVSAAQLEAEKAKNSDLVSRLSTADTELTKLRDKYDSKIAECLKDKEDLAYCERHIGELNQEINEHIAAFKNSDRIANELKAEIKHHLGELDIAQSEIEELKKALAATESKVTKK